ncbi:LacI family DNA-binding transcriptional regulator [Mangrovicoccus algicola]|nr:LacI family DNA-binding transcriptional regulator [Mangrovicoccus algicola]
MTETGKDSKPRRGRPPEGGPVTMATIGKLAGVSQVTVSRALSNPEKVSAAAMERIQEAIRVTGFVPNALAGALASRKSCLITALVPSITNVVYSSLLHGFSEIMRAEGYQLMVSETGFSPETEEALIFTHLSRRPDGILLTGIHHSATARRMLLGAGIPVVEFWDITESPIDCCVGFSHTESGRHTAEMAHGWGYRRAATVAAGDQRALRRRDGFRNRFAELSGHADIPAITGEAGPASLQSGRAALAALIEDHGFSGGVIQCSSDQSALGILTEARIRGLRVPQDVAVIGFGDQDYAAFTDPPLTTVKVDRDRLGRAAARAMLTRFRGESDPDRVTDIGFELLRRASA